MSDPSARERMRSISIDRVDALATATWVGPVAVSLMVLAFLFECLQPPAHLDDAFISYRYAKNLVAGEGLVFNPGERVEGFTNLLWTLLVALGLALGVSAKATAAALGFVFGAATLVTTHLFARRVLEDELLAIAAPALVYASTPFMVWSISGMETPLFVWAVTLSVMSASRGRFDLAFSAALIATLTRPDGVLVAAVVACVWLYDSARRRRWDWRWPMLYAGAVLLLTGFRLAYYGSPVPNTFYAKVGGVPVLHAIAYFQQFLESGPILLLPMAAVAGIRDRRLWPAGLFGMLLAAYVFAVGGDVFPDARFLLPLVPCLAVLALRGMQIGYARDRRLGMAAASLIIVALVIQPVGIESGWTIGLVLAACALAVAWAGRRGPLLVAIAALALVVAVPCVLAGPALLTDGVPSSARGTRMTESRRLAALTEYTGRRSAGFLNGLEQRPDLIATAGLGVLGYYAQFPVIDVFGLVVPDVARSGARAPEGSERIPGHQRSNADAILSRMPDVIVIPQAGLVTSRRLPAFVDLWRHPILKSDYTWDDAFNGYRRRGYLAERNPPR